MQHARPWKGWRVLCAFFIGTLIFIALANPASAHAEFVRSNPSPGASLQIPPAQVQIWFSEKVASGSSQITVRDARGEQVDNADTALAPNDATSLIVSLHTLVTGTYTVDWSVISSDDVHATQGELTFAIGVEDSAAPYTLLVQQMERYSRALQPPPFLDTVLRWWLLLAFAWLCGGVAFAPLSMRGQALAGLRELISSRRRRILWIATITTGAAILLSAIVHMATTGMSALFEGYGALFLLRVVLLIFLAMLLRTKRDETIWVLLPALMMLLTQSLLSHSAAEPQPAAPVLADWAHLTFTSLWLGGVAMLALVVAPRAEPRDLGLVIAQFSPLAMFCVLAVTLTGIVQSAGFLGSLDVLFVTSYGRTILVKIALLLSLVAFGAFHQQIIVPRLQAWRLRDVAGSQQATRRFRISIFAELGVSVLILLAAGALTALTPGRDVAPDTMKGISIMTPRTGNANLVLGVRLMPSGIYQFDLLVNDSSSDLASATLSLTPAKDITKGFDLRLLSYSHEHFVAQTNRLSPGEDWQVEAIVQHSAGPASVAAFILAAR